MGHGARFPDAGRASLGPRAIQLFRTLRGVLPPAAAVAHAAGADRGRDWLAGLHVGDRHRLGAAVVLPVDLWHAGGDRIGVALGGQPSRRGGVPLLRQSAERPAERPPDQRDASRQQPGVRRAGNPAGVVLAGDGGQRHRRFRRGLRDLRGVRPGMAGPPVATPPGGRSSSAAPRAVVQAGPLRRIGLVGQPPGQPLRAGRPLHDRSLPARHGRASARPGRQLSHLSGAAVAAGLGSLALEPRDHAAPDPRLGARPARPGFHAAEPVSEAAVWGHVGRRRGGAAGGPAAIRRRLPGQVLRRAGGASRDPHLLRLVRHVDGRSELPVGAPRRPAWEAWPCWRDCRSTWV